MEKDQKTPLQEVVYRPTTKDPTTLKPETRSRNLFPYLAAAIASLMVFVGGIAIGWTSPVLPKLKENDTAINPLGRPITPTEESWITGLLCLGSITGTLGVGWLADGFGRKKTLLLLAVPIGVSFVVTAYAKTILLYYTMRFLLGLGAGSVNTVLPMYLGEISEDHNRGTIGCFMGIFIPSGLAFAYILGPFLTIRDFTLASLVPLALFVVVFYLWIPETPHFLASINDADGLQASLMKLRKKKEVQEEASDIMKTVEEEKQKKGGIKDLLKTRGLRKGLIISVGIMILQQFSGINAVLCYMQTIFEASGGGLSPEISTIVVGLVQIIVGVLTSSVVDKLDRRVLLLISLIGCCVSLIALGGYFYLKNNTFNVDVIFWLPVTSLLVYIMSFSVGLGPLPWAVMAELFPANVKSAAATLTCLTFFIGAFVVTLVFPFLSSWVGMAQSFWVFAVACSMGAIFIYWILPETKGRSLQEIQRLLEKQRI